MPWEQTGETGEMVTREAAAVIECYVVYLWNDTGEFTANGKHVLRPPRGLVIDTDYLKSDEAGADRVRDVRAQLQEKHPGKDVVILNVVG